MVKKVKDKSINSSDEKTAVQKKMTKKKQTPTKDSKKKDAILTAKKSTKSIKTKSSEMVIVGIGASAGGLEALRGVISGLPVQEDITYVIAQHLDPRHSTMLGSILERDTDIPVIELKTKQILRPSNLYIIPPGNDAYLKNNTIYLEKATGVGPKPSVDRFFLSLSEQKGEKAVGIILSGTGSDGAHGMVGIKAEGGITIAQTTESAKFASMPDAAISTGHVDLILEPEKIGPQLSELILYPRIVPSNVVEIDENDYLSRIFRLLLDQTGGDFRNYKPATINRRIERRMAVHRVNQIEDYLTLLESLPKELDDLHQDILVSVTAFFRDPDAFEALNENIKRIVDNAVDDDIRVWIAGCATGEEAYSIAILLTEHLGNRINRIRVQVFATDLDERALGQARQGFYPTASIEKIDSRLRKKYFSQHGDSWQVVSSIRDLILFAKHDLVKAPPFSKIDLISCRNVLIYFNTTLQERVFQTFHYALRDKGLLFLGKSETTSASERLYTQVDRIQRLYQKRSDVHSHLPHLIPSGKNSIQLHRRKEAPRGKKLHPSELLDIQLEVIHKSTCVILNQHLEVTYVRGDVSAFLKFGEGRVELTITELVRSEFRHDLRGVIYKAKRENTPVYSRFFRSNINGTDYKIRFIANQFQDVTDKDSILLVFEKNEVTDAEVYSIEGNDKENNLHIKSLQNELHETKESLQTTIEELETSNEELQSTYEEAQSTNEELYTSTEELQTSNEELQSTNEELRTVNQELLVKSGQVESANDTLKVLNQQLENEIEERKIAELKLIRQEKRMRMIFDSSPAWVNVCDSEGNILRVNPTALEIMETESKSDLVGKRLSDFVTVNYIDEAQISSKDLKRGKVKKSSIEVTTMKGNIRWLELSTVILPDIEDDKFHIMSIILDQTHYKEANLKLREHQEELSEVTRLNTLGAMASGLAHELNQPLSAITNYLSGCERRPSSTNEDQAKILEAISLASIQAQRAGDIINHVKHFAKQNDFEQEKVDLNALIKNAIDLFNGTGQNGGVEYKFNLAKNLPNVLASAIQIEQVIINLLRNSVEEMTEQNVVKPMITINSVHNRKNNTVEIQVEDMGKGITDEIRDSIFKPFQSSKEEGMGMGLCISRSIIEMYGGHLSIENSSKGSAIINFELPVFQEASK